MTERELWAKKYVKGLDVTQRKLWSAMLEEAWLAGFDVAKSEAVDFLYNNKRHGFIEGAEIYELWGEEEVE